MKSTMELNPLISLSLPPDDVNEEQKVTDNNKLDDQLKWKIWEDEYERLIDQHLAEDADSVNEQGEIMTETAEPPSDLTSPLLRYQKEWLAWALKQEDSAAKGGILADEMGMGKTVQAIALVLAKREIHRKTTKPKSSKIKPTLVVCPVVGVSQWVSEIDRFTAKGSTKILAHVGSNRQKCSKNLYDYDFVITTYGIVEAEFRKSISPPKRNCVYCGKLFNDNKLFIHQKYSCGPEKDRENHETAPIFADDKSQDVVMKRIQKKKRKRLDITEDEEVNLALLRKNSVLHSVKWGRIILDEAHYVKDRRRNTAKAIFALESSYKWALTGTPLQNRVGELYSLVRFLQIVPFAYNLCKDCDCQTLNYRKSVECSSCYHSFTRHFCWWNKCISDPIQKYGAYEIGKRAMLLLKEKVLRNIVLRRTKGSRASDLALPPRVVILRRDALDVKEEDYYLSLYNKSQAQFNTYVKAGTVMNNYANVFCLLTRLRQAVDHPYLVVYSNTATKKVENLVNLQNVEQVCGICHDPAEDPVAASCSHFFCKACLLDFSSHLGQISCPTCSRLLDVDLTTKMGGAQTAKTTIKGFKASSILNRIHLDDFQTSTKIEALREEIRCMVERDGSAKGIVFSQFTSFLDLISYTLQKSGVNCEQLVGNMSLPARDAAVKRFFEDPDCKIFLMSLKAGGVALNLTVASHVFLMDPWWNPAIERQAQDRIYRIGQYKPIRIVRFIIEDTIEEKILQMQEKKDLLFEGTVGGSSEAVGKLTEADFRFLFDV